MAVGASGGWGEGLVRVGGAATGGASWSLEGEGAGSVEARCAAMGAASVEKRGSVPGGSSYAGKDESYCLVGLMVLVSEKSSSSASASEWASRAPLAPYRSSSVMAGSTSAGYWASSGRKARVGRCGGVRRAEQ